MRDVPALLARGPWPVDRVDVHWSEECYEPPEANSAAADAAISALRDRGSPAHDGTAARLVGWEERDITVSEADLREYWDKIPVTLVDGVQHDFWRVSEARLRSALTASAGR